MNLKKEKKSKKNKKSNEIYKKYNEIVEGLILAGKDAHSSYKIILSLGKIKEDEYLFEEFLQQFAFEIKNSVPLATANVVRALYKKAMKGSVRAQISWLGHFAGWENEERSISPKNKDILLLPMNTKEDIWEASFIENEENITNEVSFIENEENITEKINEK